jgi:glycosyltransferase involved in cell wall biosynthesis
VRVHRIGSAVIEHLRTKLLGRSAFNIDASPGKQQAEVRAEAESTGIRVALKRLAKVVHDATWKKVYWPDYAVLWRPAALKRAKQLIAECNYDALVTIAPPFTGHLIGLGLKRKFPSIRWIADSGDPFCFAEFSTMNSEWLYGRLNKYTEGKVFRHAEGLSVTTEETARIYAELFPFSEGKIHVIPPLLNPDCPGVSRNGHEMPEDRVIRLVYVGNFHHRLREPTTYISSIEEAIAYRAELADCIELHFLGDSALVLECLEKYPSVKKLCRFHGRSSRQAVMEALDAADIFVNIGNSTSYQLPSKVIEYASFGKPILNFTSSAQDSSAAFLSGYPLVENIQWENREKDGRAVAEFLVGEADRRMESAEIDKFIAPYRVDSIAGQYLSLLKRHSVNGGDQRWSDTQQTSPPGKKRA